jgi:hypothetical protein
LSSNSRRLNLAPVEDLVPDAARLVVSPDSDVSVTRLVER